LGLVEAKSKAQALERVGMGTTEVNHNGILEGAEGLAAFWEGIANVAGEVSGGDAHHLPVIGKYFNENAQTAQELSKYLSPYQVGEDGNFEKDDEGNFVKNPHFDQESADLFRGMMVGYDQSFWGGIIEGGSELMASLPLYHLAAGFTSPVLANSLGKMNKLLFEGRKIKNMQYVGNWLRGVENSIRRGKDIQKLSALGDPALNASLGIAETAAGRFAQRTLARSITDAGMFSGASVMTWYGSWKDPLAEQSSR